MALPSSSQPAHNTRTRFRIHRWARFPATEKAMRAIAFTFIVAAGLCSESAAAQPFDTRAFWQRAQKGCDQTASLPPNALATKIAQTALDEHYRFGGHQIDSNGRLFRFGLV